MKFQPPKGTRDLLPEDAERMQFLIDNFRSIAEKYGFQKLETPIFEDFGLLSVKGGAGEAIKNEVYYFKDKSGRELGLRFEFTVSTARVLANNPNIPKPFKRFQIGKVWRYDNPQAMRWREFQQADIDIFGSSSTIDDLECLLVICEYLDKIGFKDFFIRLNNRKLSQYIFEKFVDKNGIFDVFRIVDKLDKIGIDGVKRELRKKNIDEKDVIEVIKVSGNNKEILNKIKNKFDDCEGLEELETLLKYAEECGIGNRLKIDMSLIRGLDYYTGLVFEVSLNAKLSCGGGGRYDNLIEIVGGQKMPATGISLGLDRILEVMKENKMFKIEKSSTKIFVANVDNSVINDTVKIVQQLRKNNINSQMDLMGRNLTKQLEYASNLDIPYVLIVGKEELKKKKFKLKDMKTGEQKELTLQKIISLLKL